MRRFLLAVSAASLAICSQASANVFLFDYSGVGASGSGTFVTGNSGSPYTILSITGTANGDAITGLSSYASADNLLYYPTEPFVDFSGIAFSTASSGDFGIGWTGSAYGLVNSLSNPNGDCCGITPLSFHVTAAAVPETASWALMIVGFGMVGGTVRARRTVGTAAPLTS